MSGLDELRKRVEAAEEQFGLIAAQSRTYSERLTGLVSKMELVHTDQQREIAALNGRLGQYEQENGNLKSMLHSLLHAIEAGSQSVMGQTMRDLEGRVGRLMGDKPAPAAGDADDADVMLAEADEAECDVAAAADNADAADVMLAADADDAELAADSMADDEPEAGEELVADGMDDAAAAMAEDEDPAAEIADAADEDSAAFGEDAEALDLADEAEEDSLLAHGGDVMIEEPAGADDETIEFEDDDAAGSPALQSANIVELDDAPDETEAEIEPSSPSDLLQRVEAAANALLAAGLDAEAGGDDEDISDEISALLQDVIDVDEDELLLMDEAAAGDDAALEEPEEAAA
ncbi:MAG: hypothetical protein R3F55_22740 [Alphaproteobacteria bacterium]